MYKVVCAIAFLIICVFSLDRAEGISDKITMDAHIEPLQVHQGDDLHPSVFIANNLQYPIIFDGGCASPIQTSFDKNVRTDNSGISCFAISRVILEPGKNTTINSPPSGVKYVAEASGDTNATISFTYRTDKNQTITESRSVMFTIENSVANPDKTFVRFSNMSQNNPNSFVLISGWTMAEAQGTLFLLSNDNGKREIATFTPSPATCTFSQGQCISAVITNSNTDRFTSGSIIGIEVDGQNHKLYLTSDNATKEFGLDKIKSSQAKGANLVTLEEGQREGPLLVQNISQDSVTGYEFREYPLASMPSGTTTLHIGDIASNGCTVQLKLVKITDKKAVFEKTVDEGRMCPICLSEKTIIDTPAGPVLVTQLKEGMAVYTQDATGAKVVGTIIKIGRTLAPAGHQMVHLVLYDNRELYVSPNHPTADGRVFGDLIAGQTLDGLKIKSAQLVPYDGTFTYDLEPSGQTGFYWADKILVKSTISK